MLTLNKAGIEDCVELHVMQAAAFAGLLEKYQDPGNPGAETLQDIERRMRQPFTDYYFIAVDTKRIGAIRVVRLGGGRYRIAPMFILPEFQGQGHAQQALREAERLYPDASLWELDTIKQEAKLCHLYEKLGYRQTGREETVQSGMTIVYYEKSTAPQP